MKISELEEAVIAVCMADPEAMAEAASSLSEDRFGTHQQVYSAMLEMFFAGDGVDLIGLAKRLGPDLDSVGGVPKLRYLKRSMERLDVGPGGWRSWIKLVDGAGQLRQMAQFVDGYHERLSDLDKALMEIKDVEQFMSTFSTKFQASLGGTREGFRGVGEYVKEWKETVNDKLAGKVVDRFPSGWTTLDSAFGGFPRPGLVILAGSPSTGKTQFALQVAVGIARKLKDTGQKGCVGISSIEMTGSSLVNRMICGDMGLDTRKVNSSLERWQAERLFNAGDGLAALPLYIDTSDLVTSEMISYRAAAMHMRYGPLRFLAIDFAELIGDKRSESEELRVSGIYRKATSLAKTLNMTVMLLAQYSRKVSAKQDRLGTNEDIRYSGFAEITAHQILHIYNPVQMRRQGFSLITPRDYPAVDGRAWIICGKNREGATGSIELDWNPSSTFWSDPQSEGAY